MLTGNILNCGAALFVQPVSFTGDWQHCGSVVSADVSQLEGCGFNLQIGPGDFLCRVSPVSHEKTSC